MKTTLNKIREYSPCADGWQKLLAYLGKTKADDEPLSIATIIDSNGIDDAIWCLRAVEGHAKEIRLFAVWCARQIQHLLTDQSSFEALDVAEKYALGQATKEGLTAAWYAARVAAVRTAYAASAAWYAADPADKWAVYYAARYANAAGTSRDEMKQRQEAELRRICGEE